MNGYSIKKLVISKGELELALPFLMVRFEFLNEKDF